MRPLKPILCILIAQAASLTYTALRHLVDRNRLNVNTNRYFTHFTNDQVNSRKFFEDFPTVSKYVLNHAERLSLLFEKPKFFTNYSDDNGTSTNTHPEFAPPPLPNKNSPNPDLENARSGEATTLGVSDLSSAQKAVPVEQEPSFEKSLFDAIKSKFFGSNTDHDPEKFQLGNLLEKHWWDTQLQKKSFVLGLCVGVGLLTILILNLLSSSPQSPPDNPGLPQGYVLVGTKRDPDIRLPLIIESESLKKTSPLRFVLVKPNPDNPLGSDDDDLRLGEKTKYSCEKTPYYIAEKEVSVEQFEVLIQGRSIPDPENGKKAKTNISYEQAKEFCEKIGAQLPTEAQWEYAARYVDPQHQASFPGTVLQWCSEHYTQGSMESKIPESQNHYLVKGTSSISFSNQEQRKTWRGFAQEQGTPDVGFRPVILLSVK